MKRRIKTMLLLLLCLAATVAMAGLTACSALLPALDNAGGGSGGGSSGDGDGEGNGAGEITGNYTLDVTVYNKYWYEEVVDTSLWSVTASAGAYAKDTLVLSNDGTYTLTKEMGGDEVADARWGDDGSKNFNRYIYYGTYTATDSTTIVLSACTSIAVEVDVYSMTLEYPLGSYVIKYTETDDLDFGAGTCHEEKVVDFIYGVYIADSGYGNCSQIIKLGTYDYGTFSFVGLAEGEGTTPKPEEPVDTTPEKVGYTFTSATNEAITFDVYADGTYTFAWAANGVSESGSYVWDRLTQTLTFTDPAGTETPATIDGDKISFKYCYSVTDQLNQEYTGSVEEMEAVICDVLYELIPEADANVTLNLYGDGTYTYTDEAKGVKETGTYEWKKGVLTLTLSDDVLISSTTEGNLLKLNYTSADGTSTQSYVASSAGLSSVLPATMPVYEFSPTSVTEGNSMTFTLYDDESWELEYSLHGYTGTIDGGWTYENGKLGLTYSDGSEMEVTVNGDEISFYFDSGLTQTFKGSLAALNAATGNVSVSDNPEVVYEFASTSVTEGSSMELVLYDDGTYAMSYNLHGYTGGESGWYAWYADTDTLVLVYNDYTTAEITGDGADADVIYVYYVSPASAALSQKFKGSVAGLVKAFERKAVYEFSPTSVTEGNSMTFTLYDDESWELEYSLHGYTGTIDGGWTYENGKLGLTYSDGSEMEVTVNGDEISFYFDSGLTQTFKGSLAALNAATGNVSVSDNPEVVYEFASTSVTEGSSMELVLYDDGTYAMSYNLHGYTGGESGWYAWYADTDTLVLVYNDYTTAEITGDGADADVIYVYYVSPASAALSQKFKGSVAALTAALEGGAE